MHSTPDAATILIPTIFFLSIACAIGGFGMYALLRHAEKVNDDYRNGRRQLRAAGEIGMWETLKRLATGRPCP